MALILNTLSHNESHSELAWFELLKEELDKEVSFLHAKTVLIIHSMRTCLNFASPLIWTDKKTHMRSLHSTYFRVDQNLKICGLPPTLLIDDLMISKLANVLFDY